MNSNSFYPRIQILEVHRSDRKSIKLSSGSGIHTLSSRFFANISTKSGEMAPRGNRKADTKRKMGKFHKEVPQQC